MVSAWVPRRAEERLMSQNDRPIATALVLVFVPLIVYVAMYVLLRIF